MSTTPFLDPDVTASLYATPRRLGQRTGALHRAKTTGADATTTITTLATASTPNPAWILDVGCGRGTTTVALAHRYPAAAVLGVDRSPGLLAVVQARLVAEHRRAGLLPVADFHHLPLPTGAFDLAVASFCLYHAPEPAVVVAEIARCLRPGGQLIATTKSADSYHDLDAVIAASGLDPDATHRPSLYQSFHTDNAADVVAAAGLMIRRRLDQWHTFRFADLGHLAEYAATCPKYRLPPQVTADPAMLASQLRRHLPDGPVETASTVTYLVAAAPA
ncbi:MAG: class I SAM-dependent methyltransferase [Micromonosporaceae bacterium]|nr:class I SAM-dependent methyltransferase [Micromonosporaceae bacterium]